MNVKMKHLFSFLLVAFSVFFLSSCGTKVTPLPDSLFSANPSPLEVVGTKVPVVINGRFPEKWFPKNAVITLTPVLKFRGQEVAGTPKIYQGENIAGNGILVLQKTGASFNLESSFDYQNEMQKSELYIRFDVMVKDKKVIFPDVKVADGVIATAALASIASVDPAVAPDKFQKVIKETYDAEILFLIQQAELRSSELNSSNLAAWKDLVKNADKDSKKKVNVEVSAYASPDGGYELNEGLAEKREKNTSSYLDKEFQKNKIDTEISARYTAQDWDGFKKLVEASSLQDKDLVLRVLSMYTDPETREREIKNISMVYKELTDVVLPKLRRSRLIANVEIVGKTDRELLAATEGNMDDLSLEELLYVATLDGAPTQKVYTKAINRYPKDYRGWNNLGAYFFRKGELERSVKSFNEAYHMSPKAPEPLMNLSLFSLAVGDIGKAEEMLGAAAGANSLSEAIGLLYLTKGDYLKAVNSFGDVKSNNAALAHLLAKNYSKAQEVIDGLGHKDGVSYYLAAIIAARTNDTNGVVNNLKGAIKADPSLKQRALTDIELSKFVMHSDVSSILK